MQVVQVAILLVIALSVLLPTAPGVVVGANFPNTWVPTTSQIRMVPTSYLYRKFSDGLPGPNAPVEW